MPTALEVMTDGFSHALSRLMEGRRMTRKGWNGRGMYIFVVQGSTCRRGKSAYMTEPHILMYCADKTYVPWVASQTDLFATDWEEVEYE